MAEDTKNFKVSEFTCKCGCGFDKIDQRVMNMAQVIRDELGVPVNVNSGCRCEEHNARVKGAKNSKHIKGFAADLSCSKGASRYCSRRCFRERSRRHVETAQTE